MTEQTIAPAGATLTESERAQLSHAFERTPGLFALLSTLRTRRVGLGYRCESGEAETLSWSSGKTVRQARGPLAYVSDQEPRPLSELEEALVLWAACGPNGITFADIPVHGNLSSLMSWAGRTIPAADSNAALDVFVVNDSGTYIYRPGDERSAPVEIRSAEDYGKVLQWYRQGMIKVSDRRPDIGWHAGPEDTRSVDMMSPGQYNVNRPGSTWLIPVSDVGLDWFNLLFSCYEWWGTFLAKPEDFSPAGCDIWVKPGFLETGWPIPAFDQMVACQHAAQAGALIGNVRLACEAIGLGAWRLGAYSTDLVLGGFPDVVKGLGYRDGGPLSVMRNYAREHGGPFKDDVMEEILEHPRTHISAEWVETAVTETVQYVIDTYGVAPAFTNPVHAHVSVQVHHVDAGFYRRFHVPGDDGEPYALTPAVRSHFADFHPGESDPYARF